MEPRQAAEHHRKRANVALDIGRYDVAAREARSALGYDPRDDDALVLLARALLGSGDYARALDAVSEATRLAPQRSYCHYLSGFTLQCMGRWSDSIAPLEKAVELDVDYARYHVRLALSYAETKRGDDAVRACEHALTLAPRDGVVFENASRVFGALGQLARAEEVARAHIALEPENATGFGRLAWVLAERRSWPEAIEMARASLRLDPNNYAAWANLGYAAMQAHDDAQAETASREALRLRPGLPSATSNLVTLLRRRRAWDEAARVLAESVVRAPENRSLRQQLTEVRRERAQAATLRWSDRAAVTVVLVLLAIPVALTVPAAALVVAAVALALAWIVWAMK